MSTLVDVLAPGDRMNGKTYKDFVEGYWNWLLSNNSNSPLSGSVLYMRACYEYRTVVLSNNEIRRNNRLCGIAPHQPAVGPGITTNTPIFCPMVDACFDNTYTDEFGNSFNEPLMREACNRDIDLTERLANGRFATAPSIMTGSVGPEDIVPQPDIERHRMEIPQSGTFSLRVPFGAPLRDKMEDPAPTGDGPFQAVAAGYYVVFKIKNSGQYTIRSGARGPRDYIANMRYDITVS
jgi:hypothetical protein